MIPILEIKDLHKSFGKQKILDGVDLSFEEGKITVIIGKSGTGKSVLFKNMIGLYIPDSGKILYKGELLTGASDARWAEIRSKTGYLFQDAALFDSMTVEENIAFPLVEVKRIKNKKEIAEKVREKLEWIELPGIEKKYPSQLSGGMRKRVGLARALILEPEILFFDEPTTGLDPILADSIDKLTLKVNKELGLTCIVISHDIPAAFRMADKLAFLYEGKVIFSGTPQEAASFKNDVLESFIKNSFTELKFKKER